MGTISKLRVKVWSGAAALCLALFAPNVFAQLPESIESLAGQCTPVSPKVMALNSTPPPSTALPAAAMSYDAILAQIETIKSASGAAQAAGEGAAAAQGAANQAISGNVKFGEDQAASTAANTGMSAAKQATEQAGKAATAMKTQLAAAAAKAKAALAKDIAGVCETVFIKKYDAPACPDDPPPPPAVDPCPERKGSPLDPRGSKNMEAREACIARFTKQEAVIDEAAAKCGAGLGKVTGAASEQAAGAGLGAGDALQAAQQAMSAMKKPDGGGDNKKKDEPKQSNNEPKPDNTQAQAYNPSTGLPTSSTPSNLVAPFSGNTDTVTSDGSPGMNVAAGDVPHGEVAQAIANAANALNSGSKKSLAGEALPEGSGLGASTIGKASEYAPAKPLPGASYSGGSSFGSGASFGASASDTPKNIVGEGMNYFGLFVDEAGNEKTRELSLFEIPRDAPRRQERYKVMAEYWTTLKLAAQQRKDATPAPTASAERVPAAATPQKQ
ncbi:MAG: hypothetical protein JST16_00420 [Bdellovibrionales bacterium]|nr:hypothetical protein [Bdellovibrionales bacterium]